LRPGNISDGRKEAVKGINRTLAVVIGIVISLALSIFFLNFFLAPYRRATGRSPESMMVHSFWGIYPVSIFFGSIVTGFLVKPPKPNNLGGYLKLSPGLYLSAPYLTAIIPPSVLVLLAFGAIVLNLGASFFGLFIGKRIKY
jgi:hypothetical protein